MIATPSPSLAITRARRSAYSPGGKTSVKTGCAVSGKAATSIVRSLNFIVFKALNRPVIPLRYNSNLAMATTTQSTVRPFTNEPMSDYRKPENAAAMRAAIEKVRKELGREYDLVIGGKH